MIKDSISISDIEYELNMENYNLRFVLREYLGRDLKEDDLYFTIDEAEKFLNFILLSENFSFITIKLNRRYIDFVYEMELDYRITEVIKEKISLEYKITFDLLTTQRILYIAKLIKHSVYPNIDYKVELNYIPNINNNPVHYNGIFKYEELLKIKKNISTNHTYKFIKR